MLTVTVRTPKGTHRSFERSPPTPTPAILEEADEVLRRQRFLDGLASDFAALHEDAEAWQEEQEERAAWDATARDDLQRD